MVLLFSDTSGMASSSQIASVYHDFYGFGDAGVDAAVGPIVHIFIVEIILDSLQGGLVGALDALAPVRKVPLVLDRYGEEVAGIPGADVLAIFLILADLVKVHVLDLLGRDIVLTRPLAVFEEVDARAL